MSKGTKDDHDDQYPSVKLAYSLAIKSIEISIERCDAMDARIQSVTSLACGATFAIPLFAKSLELDVHSYWLLAIGVVFAFIILIGFFGRLNGNIQIIDPMKLFEDTLHLSEQEFRKNMICWRGQSFQENNRLVHKRWRYAVIVSFLFCVEVGIFAAWIIFQS